MLKGKIQVKSTLNKGSSFIIKLPLTNVAIKEDVIKDLQVYTRDEVLAPPAQEKQNESVILIIEDNQEVAYFIGQCLEEYNLIFAENGKIGLDKARQEATGFYY